MAASTAVGAQKTPIKVRGKEYQIKSVGADTLEATSVSRLSSGYIKADAVFGFVGRCHCLGISFSVTASCRLDRE